MASETPEQKSQQETKCSICLDYCTDPVTIHWEHTFCQVCITQYYEDSIEANNTSCCPKCRAPFQTASFQSSWQLGNIREKAKKMGFKPGEEDKENQCLKHKEIMNLFCEEDGEAMCAVCMRSPEHSSHTVILMEEAAQKYKQQIQTQLKALKEEKEKLLGFMATGEGKLQEILKLTEAEQQRITSEFQHLHQFLEEQKQLLLARLEELGKDIIKRHDNNVTKLSEKISSLSDQISEIEGKCQQPTSEFLQDIRSTLSRYEQVNFQQPVVISPESEISQQNTILQEAWKTIKDTLSSGLEKKRKSVVKKSRLQKRAWSTLKFQMSRTSSRSNYENVTLDPDTAHPQLILSEDWKSVRWGLTWQHVPHSPQRFDTNCCVLGCEGFTSGRHYWEVEVGSEGGWAVGVTRNTVKRKAEISFNPEEGIWAVECCRGQLRALTSPENLFLLSLRPRKIQISLHYDGEKVAFFNADSGDLLYTFMETSFNGDKIFPFFWVWDSGSQLKLFP